MPENIKKNIAETDCRSFVSMLASGFLLMGIILLAGCASAPGKPPVKAVSGAMPHGIKAPSVVYVSDFHLDADQIEKHGLSKHDGPIKKLKGRLKHEDNPDGATVKKLVQKLSQTIVSELNDAGQAAEYLPGIHLQDCPAQYVANDSRWLVNGFFVAVDEGNRAVEATVGFGTGGEHVEIQIAVSGCTTAKSGPFMVLGSSSGKKMMPGGLVTMNPYAMAIKFVLSKGATEKDVKKQAKEIAKTLLEQIKIISGQKTPAG